MPRFAAFDVGTNTVLMAVAERGPDGRFRALLEREEITRLGEGLARAGSLSAAAMERTAEAIRRFADEARALGVDRMVAGATSAAREAANGAEFVRLVRARAGVEVEILSGEEEARLTFRAVQADHGGEGRPLVAIDVGGGSTEVVFGGPAGAPTMRRSLEVGSVRLTERFVTAHPIPAEERAAIRAQVRVALVVVPRADPGSLAVAVAATATSLAAVAARRGPRRGQATFLAGGDTPEEGARKVACPLAQDLAEWLADLSIEERRRVPGLDPRRADVICAGAYVLLETLAHLGLDSFVPSDRGVRWGLLLDRFGR